MTDGYVVTDHGDQKCPKDRVVGFPFQMAVSWPFLMGVHN